MKLNGIDLGRAWCSAGARNFFGDGWPHHRWLGPLAPDFRGSMLVAKTTTVEPRDGNLPLDDDLMPTEARPACIVVNFRKAAVLNAVGLSGPGLVALLADGRWQAMGEPFVLSFAAVAADAAGRDRQAESAASRLNAAWPGFSTRFAVELNVSCPNTESNPAAVEWARALLWTFAAHLSGVPLIPKINILLDVSAAREIAEHRDCAAICVSNTIPYGALPDRIDWQGLFGDVSPLAHLGGGGLSGAPLTPLVREWVAEFRRIAPDVPLVAGGGVMRPTDATALLDLGADAVEVGSVAIVRPWRVGAIIKAINEWRPRDGN
jgi:dihydroorotate dehydrogenase (NAD+) catalytic subunit